MARPLPSSFDGDEEFYEENRLTKLKRRLLEEPLIPLGCALTCVALWKASRAIKAGNKLDTNRFFRARIYAQGFTVAAMLGGSWYWQSERAKRKQLGEEARARAADEKKRAWIRELERRDVEDRALVERARTMAEKRRSSSSSSSSSAPARPTPKGEDVAATPVPAPAGAAVIVEAVER